MISITPLDKFTARETAFQCYARWHGQSRDLNKALSEKLKPISLLEIEAFYKYWPKRDTIGWRNRAKLERSKRRIIRQVLKDARAKGWEIGFRDDSTKRGYSDPYRTVLYVDTPEGQVSFHVFEGDWLTHKLPYQKTFAGEGESLKALRRLYGDEEKIRKELKK